MGTSSDFTGTLWLCTPSTVFCYYINLVNKPHHGVFSYVSIMFLTFSSTLYLVIYLESLSLSRFAWIRMCFLGPRKNLCLSGQLAQQCLLHTAAASDYD
jgi:hypothetical protein